MEHQHENGAACPKCWAKVATPLFCESCREILPVNEAPSPFQALGLRAAFPMDAMALRKRLMKLSRQMHPDFYVNSDDPTRERAERNTAELNAAFEVLSDDFRRADWLVNSLAGPSESDERQMPPAFLADVMEWNEAVEDARESAADSPQRSALVPLEQSLQAERQTLMQEISDLLTPLPDAHAPVLGQVRRRLNALRYLARILHQISELRLIQAPQES